VRVYKSWDLNSALSGPSPWDCTILQKPDQCFICLCYLQGPSRVRDVGQHQLSSQGGLAEYHPRPMNSPPPLRRASLPFFTATYNPANPIPPPPLLNTLAHTPPLFLDALEGGSALAHHDNQSLQTDTRSAQFTADCDMNARRWFEHWQRAVEMTRAQGLQTGTQILGNTGIMMPWTTAPVIAPAGSRIQLLSFSNCFVQNVVWLKLCITADTQIPNTS